MIASRTFKRRSSFAFFALAAATGGCAVGAASPAEDSPVEQTGHTEDALYGAVSTSQGFPASGSCPEFDGFINQAMNVGRFVAKTPEFAQCVFENYRRCAKDDYPFSEPGAVLQGAQMPNDTNVRCAKLTDKNAQTNGGVSDTVDEMLLGIPGLFGGHDDSHDLTYKGTEQLNLAETYLRTSKTMFEAGDMRGLYNVAGTIWHEASHVYGFSHGDNKDANEAKKACGRTGDKDWFWKLNSAPFTMTQCMIGAWTNGGRAHRVEGMPGPEVDSNKTLVDVYFERANKRPFPGQVADIHKKIAGGHYTPEDLRRETSRNSTMGSSPFALNTTRSDELTGPLDNDWYLVTIPQKMDITIVVQTKANPPDAPSPGAVGPLPGIDIVSLKMLDPHPALIRSRTFPDRKEFTFTLWAGQFAVHLAAAPAFTTFDVTIEDGMQEPQGCSYSVLCDGMVQASCNDRQQVIFALESQSGDAWVRVGQNAFLPRNVQPSMGSAGGSFDGKTANYRVCAINPNGNTSGEICTAPETVTHATRNSCSGSLPGYNGGRTHKGPYHIQ